MANQYYLRVSSPDRELEVHPLESRRVTLGRSPDCEVVIGDPWISRKHVELEEIGGGKFQLRDLSSRNPPRIGGITRREAVIGPGVGFQLGATRVLLSANGLEEKSSTSLRFGGDPSPDAVTTVLPLDPEPPEPASAAGRRSSPDTATRFRRLASLGERVAAAPRPSDVISVALDGVMQLVPASRGFIGIGEPLEGEYAEITVRDPAHPDGSCIEMSRTILETIFADRSAMLVTDARRMSGRPHDSIVEIGIRAFAAAPLIVGGRFAGVIYLDSTNGRGTLADEDLEIIKVVARFCSLALENLAARDELRDENDRLRGILRRRGGMIGSSPSMRTVLNRVARAGGIDTPVLIVGETGTGKELAARSIHDQSPRREGPFVAFTCTIASETMIDAELFGHVRGAFTDAVRDHQGVFERAHGGTLFLDEIGDMPLATQGKILRAVQEGRVSPVGGEEEIEVDVRIISATHRDLEARQKAGLFREDLRYRLDVIRIEMPPLRDRGEDILEIAEALLPPEVSLSDGAKRALANHPWPGNVRELRNVMEQALFHATGPRISVRDLPAAIARGGRRVRLEVKHPSLAELERRHIQRVLEATGGNKKQAAEILGIARETLYQKLRGWERDGGES